MRREAFSIPPLLSWEEVKYLGERYTNYTLIADPTINHVGYLEFEFRGYLDAEAAELTAEALEHLLIGAALYKDYLKEQQ